VTQPAGGAGRPLWVPALYPIVIALVYLSLLFLGIGVSIHSALRVFIAFALGAALIGVVANLVMRDRHRGGLFALTIVLLVILGGDPRYAAAIALVIVLLVVERLAAARSGSTIPWPKVTRALNLIATIGALTLVVTGIQQGGFGRIVGDLTPLRPVTVEPPAANRPDIYVLLLDGHARPDKMLSLFGYDDSWFVSALEDRGFEFSKESRSNYLLTVLSVPSLLNMQHIDELIADASPKVPDPARYRSEVRKLVDEAEVDRRMRGLGYEIVSVSGGFEELVMHGADQLIDTGQLNEFEIAMARETAIGPFVMAVAPDFFAEQQRSRVVSSLKAVIALAQTPSDQPRFTFIHIPSPHGPIVFGPEGQLVPARDLKTFFEDTATGLGLTREEFGRRYVGQIQYLDGQVIETIDGILAASPEPPVILVLSDHGSGSGLNWGDLAHSDLDERTSNLFAALTPGHPDLFPQDITLINVFGRLLHGYFGIDVPQQPNLVFRWDDTYTHLIEVPELSRGIDP